MKSIRVTGWVVVFSLFFSAFARAEVAPKILSSNGKDLAAAREKYKAGDKATVRTVKDICKDADAALKVAPYSVVNKEMTPPSGDKHDYASLSPYWWPDPSKPDGKPYIRKDGQFNPERAKYDLEPLDKMSKAVEALGFAYYFTGEEKYAQKAAELIRTWFIDESTKMNPNLQFAQFVPGYTEPRPSGIIEGGRFRRVVDGEVLIRGSQSWSAADSKKTQEWFGELLKYIETSKQGKEEIKQPNNHGTWVAVQRATYALAAGNENHAKEILEKEYKERIASQIKPDGTQPEELARTISYHYSRFNILAFCELAMLGEHVGLNLWDYKTEDGRSLRTAIDYLIPYTMGEEKWPHKQISEMKTGDMIVIFRRAANAYNEPKYEALAKKLQEKEDRGMVELLFPAKVQ